MGTIQQDIHDLASALDFFSGYATQEDTVPADYEIGLLHAGWLKLSDALNFARQTIGAQLQPNHIATLPTEQRAAAVLWFVHTLCNRKGDALARVWASLKTYPVESLPSKFNNAGAISDWVKEDAPPWATPKQAAGTPPNPMKTNRFGVQEAAGVVRITAYSARISPSEALNLAAHLEVAASCAGGSPVDFADFMIAAQANLGHAPSATETRRGAPACPDYDPLAAQGAMNAAARDEAKASRAPTKAVKKKAPLSHRPGKKARAAAGKKG